MTITRREALKSIVAASVGIGAFPMVGLAGEVRGDRAAGGPIVRTREMTPFEIDFGRGAIRDLHRRIDNTRWPGMPFETGWSAGTSDAHLRELVSYWRREYDWSRVQAQLNTLNHLRGEVGGEQMHCVHYRAEGPKQPFPLLLLHGWPGSFHEFSRAAPSLAAGIGGAAGFDVVVPSLPGFVFSEAPREPGMSPARMAERLHLLMRELGYDRYGVQGGDWGAIIGTQMARRYPESIVGFHMNFVASAPPPPAGTTATPAEEEYRARRSRFQAEETGYSSIQGSRPQTLGYAQTDSPVGWLAWLLEKYYAWTDHRGDLWGTVDKDAILTTAMLYWLPGSILSAARIYYESSRGQPGTPSTGRVMVPTGYAHFPAEPWGPPREVVERSYNLVHYTEMERGGHFPALEQPAIWSADVAGFFAGLG